MVAGGIGVFTSTTRIVAAARLLVLQWAPPASCSPSSAGVAARPQICPVPANPSALGFSVWGLGLRWVYVRFRVLVTFV